MSVLNLTVGNCFQRRSVIVVVYHVTKVVTNCLSFLDLQNVVITGTLY